MENASKALLMAGGVLISLMIIGALMLMFNSLSSYQNSGNQDAKEAEIIAFNNQYATFARDNVRGSDIYSLLNKVVDYNTRKSTVGNIEGKAIAYKPMTVKVTIKNRDLQKMWYTTERNASHLIGSGTGNVEIVVSATTNDFDAKFRGNISAIESYFEGEDAAKKLVTAMTSICIEDSSDDNAKSEAVRTFNSICKKMDGRNGPFEYKDINENSVARKNIYLYSEYVQFKRARFNCTNTKYDDGTARIIEMTFESNGKFE